MFAQLLAYNNVGLFILRLAIGVIFLYHSWPKLKNSKMMSQAMGMSSGRVLIIGAVELVCALGMILGVYTQLSALLLAVVMVGAIDYKITKWHFPFDAMDKIGWEFDLILLAANIAVLLGGGGSIGIQ